jgi:hypothetical protein
MDDVVGIFLYLLLIPYAMQIKLIALLFVATVLASSFAASVLPMANALTARTDFSNRHTTATLGNSKVCGDHICGPGEKTAWANKMASLQHTGTGKIGNATTYQQVLQHIKLTSAPTTMHGNAMKLTEKMNMGSNMTDTGNKTKSTK